MDLMTHTLDALDWPLVLEALADEASTTAGRRAARTLRPLPSAAAIRAVHDAIEEVVALDEKGAAVHVASIHDVAELVRGATKSQVLEPAELKEVGDTLLGLEQLGEHLLEHADDAPELARLAAPIALDLDVTAELRDAFDRTGQLSGERYPELAELRRTIQSLHESIRKTLEDLVGGDELSSMLQDRFVTQRGDRYVLPLKAFAKGHDVGIVHGTSGSGQTVFVEPHQVVRLNNKLRLAEGDLQATERRILVELSRLIGLVADRILPGLDAATAIDLVLARRRLAERLQMTRPSVRETGIVTLGAARHPVLALREVEVVPNDLALDGTHPVLVLSGPNAGGKTVALKTIGLCALLVQIGCFVPAAPGSRVDRFDEVLALIGDVQTVQGDLSTFSGHLAGVKAMLDHAAPGHLFLLDELAVGTDPTQGAALAQAVLEQLLETGARVVVTTHYARLKGLATLDDRFQVAAVELRQGEPTYHVAMGVSGESHALRIARRMGLDPDLLARTEALLGEGERALTEAAEKLDAERGALAAERERASSEADRLEQQAADLARREKRLKERADEQQAAADFLNRLKAAEQAIAAVVAELQANPDHAKVREAKATIASLRDLVPSDDEEAPPAPDDLAEGDRVQLRLTGQEGRVRSAQGDRVTVEVRGKTLRLKAGDVERLPDADEVPRTHTRPQPRQPRPRRSVALDQVVRLPGNTLDLRGQRVDEAMASVEKFVDQAALRGFDAVFLLHGHGTGALKSALRTWLPQAPGVKQHTPATAEQGGDAYTVVEIA